MDPCQEHPRFTIVPAQKGEPERCAGAGAGVTKREDCAGMTYDRHASVYLAGIHKFPLDDRIGSSWTPAKKPPASQSFRLKKASRNVARGRAQGGRTDGIRAGVTEKGR